MEYPKIIKNLQNPDFENPLGVEPPVSINGAAENVPLLRPPPPSDATEDRSDGEKASKFKTITEEYQWQHKRERECNGKILDQENGFDDDNSRRRRHKSNEVEENRQWENEDDMQDRLREDEKITEEKRRAIEDQLQQKNEPKNVLDEVYMGTDKIMIEDKNIEGNMLTRNGGGHISVTAAAPVHSVFHEHEADDANKGKRIWPTVPLNNLNEPEVESEINMQSSERLTEHDRDQNDVRRKKHYVDVQRIVDMVPKTMEEVFSYKIDWDVSDKHELHELMRPWLSERVLKYMEEESVQDFMVDWIGSSIEKHESPSEILDTLKPMLKDEAEMFFVSLWRMFLFEIKKAEKAEQISNINHKEKRSEVERPIYTRSGDRLSVQGQYCTTDVNKYTTHDSGSLNLRKAFDVKKFWQDEPFPDFIPKTKEELLAYNINWSVSNKHELHKKMGPWISLKVMDVREKDVPNRVEEIVNTIKNHVCASDMVKQLHHLFDEETDMFVANMLAMLIFQIKKVQTELDNEVRSEVEMKINMQSVDVETSSLGYVNKVKLIDSESIQAYRDMVMSFDSEQRYKLRWITKMRPKTKEAVFSYEINWDVYRKYGLLGDTREWLVKEIPKIINGKEEALQVYNLIMSSILRRVSASRMLELLQPSLGEKSEMFVYRLWSWIILGHNLERENAFARGT